jgi:hypothetical protein
MKKIMFTTRLLLLFVFGSFCYCVNAQETETVIEKSKNTVDSKLHTDANVKYTLTIDQVEYVKENSETITSEIGKVPGVIENSIDVTDKAIVVICKLDGNTQTYADVKAKLATYNIKLLIYKKEIIKLKNK